METQWIRTAAFFVCINTFILNSQESSSLTVHFSDLKSVCYQSLFEQPTRIDAIDFKCDVDIARDELLGLLDFKEGDTLDQAGLARACLHLKAKEKFKSVTFCLSGTKKNHLTISLASLWTLKQVSFSGIMLGKESYRRYYCIEPGEPFSKAKHHYSLRAIKQALYKEGYVNAIVTDSLIKDEHYKRVSVTIAIALGKHFLIGDSGITLKDSGADFADELRVLIAKKGAGHGYTGAFVTQLTVFIKEYLVSKGYCGASLELEESTDLQAQAVNLHFIITPGPQRPLLFRGNHFLSDDHLKERLMLFGHALAQLPDSIIAQEITRSYQQEGYDSCCVTIEKDNQETIFVINEGERQKIDAPPRPLVEDPKVSLPQEPFTFGSLVVADCDAFPREYIERELHFKRGDSWNQEQFNDSLHALQHLSPFEYVHMSCMPPVPGSTERSVVIRLFHDDPRELALRGGIGLASNSYDYGFNQLTYAFGGTFIVKNPLNYADQLTAECDFSRGNQSAQIYYQHPWLYTLPIKTTYEIYRTRYVQPGYSDQKNTVYNFLQQGFLTSFSGEYLLFQGALSLGCEWIETRIGDSIPVSTFLVKKVARALNFEPQLFDQRMPFLVIEPTLMIDRTNNRLDSTQGTFTLISFKGMIPLNRIARESSFFKLFIEQSFFIPVESWVIGFRVKGGHIFHNNFRAIMPSERFYLGGANSIRSYDTDLAPPLGVVSDFNGENLILPQGSKSLFLINIEVRFPLFKTLSGVVFQDFGALNNNALTDIKAHNILAGSGFGIRFATPIGPLRFDIAWKWTREKYLGSYAWFLTFGNAF